MGCRLRKLLFSHYIYGCIVYSWVLPIVSSQQEIIHQNRKCMPLGQRGLRWLCVIVWCKLEQELVPSSTIPFSRFHLEGQKSFKGSVVRNCCFFHKIPTSHEFCQCKTAIDCETTELQALSTAVDTTNVTTNEVRS